MNKVKVYLAGPMEQVSKQEACIWRQKAVELLGPKFETLDPTRRIHNNDAALFYKVYSDDLEDIKSADLVLVNLGQHTVPKNGTSIEIFYAAEVLGKEIVAFSSDKKSLMHPFIYNLVNFFYPTLPEAVDHIKKDYL